MGSITGVVGQHNLPQDLTSLIGREWEQRQVSGLIASHRVVSLVGVGGVGKTRLALAVARASLADHPDGIWLVELGPITDSELLPAAVAASVGLAVGPRRPVIETLIAGLASRRVLLILDNCEHLVQRCAELVERLVRTCAHLRVLVTSRAPLGVPGEVAWQVAPLTTPDEPLMPLDQLAEVESIRLFVERAQAALPSFALSEANADAVAQVCRSLDGLPLALELAAAGVRMLAPHQLAARLDNRFKLLVRGSRTAPARQRTLESAVAWSYDLLEPDDRRLFDGLSVFAGGFSLDAVEAVCDLQPEHALNGLTHLVDQSLVLTNSDDAGDRRYCLLETLRAYGRDRLRERGEDALLRQRLATWVLTRAETAGAALRGPEQTIWLRWAEREHDNIRSALDWAIDSAAADTALRVVAALWWSWIVHDRWTETQELLDCVLSLPGADDHSVVRGQVLHAAATTAALSGQYALARVHVDECFSLARELGDDELLLACHSAQALLFQQQGETEAAQPHVEAMLELAERLSRPWYKARAAEFVASRALRSGDLSAAAGQLEQAVKLARAAGDSWNVAMLLGQLGDVERMRGTHSRAAPLYHESIRLFQALGLREDPSRVHNLAYVALAEGQNARAATLFTQALRVFRRIGDQRGVADCLIGLGCVRSAERRPAEAARLFGVGEAALEALGSVVWPSNRADYQHWDKIARAAIGARAWEDAWTSARALGLDSIVEDVLIGDPANMGTVLTQTISRVDELTPREREVAQLAARGLSSRRIGETLVIAEKTAANHLQNALDKLDVHSRSELAARAVELGLLS